MKPAMVLPPITFLGCASGVFHAENTTTAWAPNAPTSSTSGVYGTTRYLCSSPSTEMPVKAPMKL